MTEKSTNQKNLLSRTEEQDADVKNLQNRIKQLTIENAQLKKQLQALQSDSSDATKGNFVHIPREADALIADSIYAISKKIARIALVDLTKDQFKTLLDRNRPAGLPDRNPDKLISAEITYFAKNFIHPDDAELFLHCASNDYILRWFDGGLSEYHHYYRRLTDGSYRWVHLYIVKTDRYSAEHREFYYFVEDANDLFMRLLDHDNMASFSKHYRIGTEKDLYYGSLTNIIDGLTSEYLDFYLIDLEKDLYVKYKSQSRVAAQYLEPVASYTQTSEAYIKEHYNGELAEFLLKFSSSKKLQKLMKDRFTIEYGFTAPGGSKVKTICQKIESIDGIPTKLLCRTVLENDSKKLIVKTFGNFDVLKANGEPVIFSRKQSKQLFAYLVDKQGFPVSSRDIVTDILEKSLDDSNAIKYVSTLIKRTMDDLRQAGYPDVIIKEQRILRIDPEAIDCDYYHLKNGDFTALSDYHNEYMKEYSWAENTNAEISAMISSM